MKKYFSSLICFCLVVIALPIRPTWRYFIVVGAAFLVIALITILTRPMAENEELPEAGRLRQIGLQILEAFLAIIMMVIGLFGVASGYWVSNALVYVAVFYLLAKDITIPSIGGFIIGREYRTVKGKLHRDLAIGCSNMVQFAPIILGLSMGEKSSVFGSYNLFVLNIILLVTGLDIFYLLFKGRRLVDTLLKVTVAVRPGRS